MYTLPKIWQGRIQRYWDKTIPTNIPMSSSEFSLQFTDDEKAVIKNFEDTLGKEESPLVDIIPENSYIGSYIGTYNVEGEAGVRTLLCPEAVDTKEVIAMHYNKETSAWEKIEDASVDEAGYIWGTLDSFSPIAIVTIRPSVFVTKATDYNYLPAVALICNGNPVKVVTRDGNIIATDSVSGTEFDLTALKCNFLIAGSIDGSDVKDTNLIVDGINHADMRIYAGSYFWSDDEDVKSAVVKNGNVSVYNSTVRAVTGSGGMVRSENLNILVDNTTVKSHVGTGESIVTALGKDANKEPMSLESKYWIKKATIKLQNKSNCMLFFCGSTCGLSYDVDVTAILDDSTADYFVGAGSNGHTLKNELIVQNNARVGLFQTINRGIADYAMAKFTNSFVDSLYVFGDPTDSTVTGTIEKVRVEINAGEGKYNVMPGTLGGIAVTDDNNLEVIKISHNADVVLSDDAQKIFGSKIVIK